MNHNIERNGEDNNVSPWLASILLQHEDLFPRFAHYVIRLQQMPRGWRLRLRRKLSLTLSGAALMMAMMAPPAFAVTNANITIVNKEVVIANNNKCSLVEAIANANDKTNGRPYHDCLAGNPSGADTIVLPSAGTFVLTSVNNSGDRGDNGLPWITSEVTIEGNGSTIRRGNNAPAMRILAVGKKGDLTLNHATISGGEATGGSLGGGILNQNVLKVVNSTVTGNTADQGAGIGAESFVFDYDDSQSAFLDIESSTISDNHGQGIVMVGGELTVEKSTISGNDGAGIAEFTYYSPDLYRVDTYAQINDSTISDNGGIGLQIEQRHGEVSLVNSTISSNADSGIFLGTYGSFQSVNSTITGNHTSGSGGGIFMGIGDATLTSTIISGNSADQSGDEIYDAYNFPSFHLDTTMVGTNSNAGWAGNLAFDGTLIVPSEGINEILGPLADNGGPTMTHALVPNSPAIDRFRSADCVGMTDQRGMPRNVDGNGQTSTRECDLGAFEYQPTIPPAGGPLFVSATGSGTVGGTAFAPADILRYDQAQDSWSMFFDGSDVQATKNVGAFAMQSNGDLLMAWTANQAISGQGTFIPQDIARFVPSQTGNNTAGSFAWAFDGSDVGLTTSGERIDALGVLPDGRLLISTTGSAVVPGPGNSTIKAQDEDVLAFTPTTLGANTSGTWALYFDGTPISGLKGEDINGFWQDPAMGDRYITIVGAFNLGGVKGNGKDIVKLTPNAAAPGGYVPSLYWDGSAFNFPSNLDGLEMHMP